MDRQSQGSCSDVKKALQDTVLLSDGRLGYIFTELPSQSSTGRFSPSRWECHVCNRIIDSERAMQMHLSHPLHTSKLRVPYHPPCNFKKILSNDEHANKKSRKFSPPREQTEDKNINKKDGGRSWGELATQIRPGEPVPPGMEDVAQRVCQLQTTLDQYHDRPLIGIEYIVELVSMEENTEPRYICLLCEKKGDPRSLMLHLTSQNHNLKYISCFFRTAGNAINMIPRTPETRRGIAIAISKIAEEIEKQFGRLKPTSAIAEMFAAQKYDILREIDEKKHFRETPTTTFLQYCSLEVVKEYATEAENEMAAAMKRSPADLPPGTGPNKELKTDDVAPSKLAKCKPKEAKNTKEAADPRHPLSKLCFTIGKPERSLGRNVQNKSESHDNSSNKDDDEVIFVATNDDPIEIGSMSSISSDSGGRSPMGRRRSRSMGRGRLRPLSRSRSRERVRRLPRLSRRDSPPRRRDLSPKMRRDIYTRGGARYRSRSNSRSRERKYTRARDDFSRERERGRRRELGRLKGEERERDRRDRYKRSLSMERDTRKRPQAKSPDVKKKKIAFENNYKMEQYRKKLHDLEVEMDNKLKYFRERPEKHPNYSEEWKNFWNRRYKEIQQSGKDPSTYDFKPEWIIFWDDRMKKLHEEELDQKKDELKKYLPSEDEKGPSDDLQDISPPTPEGERDITVDDIKNTWKALTGSEIKAPVRERSGSLTEKSPLLRRSPSPWELELPRMKQTQLPRPKYIDTATPIVHCLRMLSVLEQQLGSLGPKVLDMLSRALTLEKTKVNESMTLLHDEDIHIFFETIKEKIRGQLLAGIVARFLVNSCRSLIGAIENMLSAHPAKAKPRVLKPLIPIPEPVQVEGVGVVNKMAVAQQIAEALVAQGRTDVTQHELEGLINAVVGIAATSNTNLNQSSNAFFSQLNIHKSTANSHINELLSNLISSARESLGVAPAQSQPQNVAPPHNLPLRLEVASEPPNPLQQELLQAPTKPASAASSLFSTVSNTLSAGLLSPSKPLPKKTEKEESILEKGESEDQEVSESISDDDLKDRLLQFKTLSREKQQQLILLLKELESKEPERVEKLRKYVSLGLTQDSSKTASSCLEETQSGRLSPFSSRAGGTNPAPEEKPPVSRPFAFDSDREEDDDDYTVEDVYKTVSEKLKKKEDERKPVPNLSIQRDLDENSSQSFSNPMQPFSSLSPPPNLFSSYPLEPSKAKDVISDVKPSVAEGRPFQALNKTDYKVFPPSRPLEPTYNRTYPPPAEKSEYVEISSYKTNEWQPPDRASQRPENKGWGNHETYPGGNRTNPGALARDSRSNFDERFVRADIYPAGNRPDAFPGGRAASTAQYGSESRQDMYPGQGMYRGAAPPSANRTYQQQALQGSSYSSSGQYKPATPYGGGQKDSGYRMAAPPPQNPLLPPYQIRSYNPRPLGYQPPSKGQPYSNNNYNRQY